MNNRLRPSRILGFLGALAWRKFSFLSRICTGTNSGASTWLIANATRDADPQKMNKSVYPAVTFPAAWTPDGRRRRRRSSTASTTRTSAVGTAARTAATIGVGHFALVLYAGITTTVDRASIDFAA
jgi:hypothetical protein